MEPDYKRMWNDWKKAMGACDHGFIVTEKMLEEFERRNTPWKPKDGEWVWCPTCEKPVMYPGSSFGSCEGHKFENVEPHLPILEYKGFKVGEDVIDDTGGWWHIDRLDFEFGQEVWIGDENKGGIWLNFVQHLPPPEPKVGEWVWDTSIDRPHQYHGLDCSDMEPLQSHLPILKYKGFKVGDLVTWGTRASNHHIAGFKFVSGNPAQAWFKSATVDVNINDLVHMPPPEPKCYCCPWDISKFLDDAVKEYLKNRTEPED